MTNYLGVDSGFFDGNREDFDPLSVLFVGRLVRRKGVDTLIQSVDLLRNRGLDVRLTVVGEGPELEGLKGLAAASQVPVEFSGKKNLLEIRELLRKAAVLCAPSTTKGGEVPEALGLVLIEAQAMSVPVVGTRNGGIPETMVDGETGYLVAEDAPAELAEALGRLLGDGERNRRFGERARALICERFDIARSYERIEALYDQILGRAGND